MPRLKIVTSRPLKHRGLRKGVVVIIHEQKGHKILRVQVPNGTYMEWDSKTRPSNFATKVYQHLKAVNGQDCNQGQKSWTWLLTAEEIRSVGGVVIDRQPRKAKNANKSGRRKSESEYVETESESEYVESESESEYVESESESVEKGQRTKGRKRPLEKPKSSEDLQKQIRLLEAEAEE